jgi:precorrin-4 methylase
MKIRNAKMPPAVTAYRAETSIVIVKRASTREEKSVRGRGGRRYI